jgi:LmbE family N-acetylglucosaminyl deacetylase
MIRRILNKIESIFKYRYLANNEKGSYNILLKKIYKSTDIDFLENVWQFDYFREILEPKELNHRKHKKVLILAPHQDDEIIGCGGTLLRLKNIGASITIAYLTDGAELSNAQESVERRKKEAQALCDNIGGQYIEIGINNVSLGIRNKHLNSLIQLLNKDWDMIYSVWPIDQPPKHRLCSYFLGKALLKSSYNGQICLYAVHTDLLPNYYTDISDLIEEKQSLFDYYPSQMRVQNYKHMSKGLDAWRVRFLPVSSELRFIETFMKIPSKSYIDFLDVFDKSKESKLFKGHIECIKSFNDLKRNKY